MDANIKERLEALLTQLHLHREASPAAAGAHGDVQAALADGSTTGLGDRLDAYAVELDTSHPSVGAVVRELVDELSAMGI